MKEVCEIAIAALLHDVGKVLHRARAPLSQQAERMEQIVCPTGQSGRGTHRHVLWTSDFIEQIAPHLPGSLDHTRIKRLASAHHRPSEPDEWLIAEADRLASGHDRRPDEAESSPSGFRTTALQSVFCRLRLDDAKASPRLMAWIPAELSVDESLLPIDSPDLKAVEAAWAPLAGAMAEFAEKLDLRDLPHGLAVQAMAGFSERFQTLVPASAMDRPDVSLYDHTVVTAAIASALHQYHQHGGSLTDETDIRDRDAPKYRFVVGSLAGIQDFIFTLPDEPQRGIAKTFRAKSFYVSAVTDAVVLRVLQTLGLPATNCVLHAGGRFVILADSSQESLTALSRIDRELQEWFLVTHLGTLGLNMAYDATVSGQDMLGGRFAAVYRQIENQADRAKVTAMAACTQEAGNWSPDSFLHRRRPPHELILEQIAQARLLGQKLPRVASFGLFTPGEAPEGLLEEPIDCCGLDLQLSDRVSLPSSSAVLVSRIGQDGEPVTWAPSRPLANHVPILDANDVAQVLARRLADTAVQNDGEGDEDAPAPGRPATFEHLAVLSRRLAGDGFTGQPMLACLKADMDRLGLLLARGFGSDVSFARIASTSRFLDLFFKGYLTHRMTEAESPFRHVYTVFAGGDDLMLIGPWRVMFDFALELRGCIERLTGANPAVTLSASLILGHAKMPPSHMARLADDQLALAKQAGRNLVSALGRVMTWQDFEEGLNVGHRLDEMILASDGAEGLKLNRSFVYRLLQYARKAEAVAAASREGRSIPLTDLTWRSHFLYDLHRNVERPLGEMTQRRREDMEWLRSLLGVRIGKQARCPVILGTTYALYLNRGA